MFGTNLKNYGEQTLKTATVVFSVVLTFVFTSYAQNINDDLTPKATVSKPTGKPVKPVKSPGKGVKLIKPKPNRTSVVKPTRAAPRYKAPIISETSDEIIDRYLNYSQTASVTSKDWASVLNQAQRSIKTNPSDNKAAAQLLIAQGQITYNQRDFSNALTQFNAAARVFPNSVLPFYCIGKVYLVTKQPNEAKDNFEKAIRLNGNFALAYRGLGEALTAQGKSKKAQEYFRQASRIGLAKTSSGNANTAVKANVPGNSFNDGQRNLQASQTAQPRLTIWNSEKRVHSPQRGSGKAR
jgi:Tetratricopeptide repeat